MNLIKWDEISNKIATAKDIQEMNLMSDKLRAMEVLSRQSHQSLETQNKIAEYRLRLDRKRGEWLKENIQHEGGRPKQSQDATVKLKDVFIAKDESVRLQQIADIPEKQFEAHIAEVKSENEELTRAHTLRLAQLINKQERNKKLKKPILPDGKFDVIYADPPWEYDNSGISGAANNHYPTMSTEKICELKVPTANNAVLFLWVTNPFLKEGLEVCSAWGFEYKTNMVWIKDKAGQGFYVKGQHELLFICIKGNYRPDDSLFVRSVISAPREKHSQKPEIFYKTIEKLYPKGKYLELFGREKRHRWTVWGNEC
jgi:N6-adenosine-specific RNA methylase IME4